MQMVQVEFAHVKARKVVWIDASHNLKSGNKVTFKDGNLEWDVIKVYDTKIEAEHLDKKWGLNLPKSQRTER